MAKEICERLDEAIQKSLKTPVVENNKVKKIEFELQQKQHSYTEQDKQERKIHEEQSDRVARKFIPLEISQIFSEFAKRIGEKYDQPSFHFVKRNIVTDLSNFQDNLSCRKIEQCYESPEDYPPVKNYSVDVYPGFSMNIHFGILHMCNVVTLTQDHIDKLISAAAEYLTGKGVMNEDFKKYKDYSYDDRWDMSGPGGSL